MRNCPGMPSAPDATTVAPRPLCISYLPIAALKPDPCNARTHPKRQVEQIAASIRAFGFANPVLVDGEGNVIAGHGRLLAARSIGLVEVPTIALGALSEGEKRALRLADNKIALGSGWDRALLKAELAELAALDFGMDLTITGFSTSEIGVLMAPGGDADDDVAVSEVPPRPRACVGDIWTLGAHRIGCGDARDEAFVRAVVGEGAVDAVFLDLPPELRTGDAAQLREWLAAGVAVSRSGAVHFLCTDWRGIGAMHAAGETLYGALLNLCVWNRQRAGAGSPYRSQLELVFVYRVGDAAHHAAKPGRQADGRSNLWEHAPVRSRRTARGADAGSAQSDKPIALIEDALCDVTRAGDLVLDTFLGTGATLIATERSGRRLRAIEGAPARVDAAIDRWVAQTGGEARRVAGGAA